MLMGITARRIAMIVLAILSKRPISTQETGLYQIRPMVCLAFSEPSICLGTAGLSSSQTHQENLSMGGSISVALYMSTIASATIKQPVGSIKTIILAKGRIEFIA